MRGSNEATINVELDPSQLIKRYKREIRDLRHELAMHDTLANRGRVVYELYSPEQYYQIQLVAEKFLETELDDTEIESFRQALEIFSQIRNIYRKMMTRLGADNVSLLKEKTGKLRTRIMEPGKKRMLQASGLPGPILICYLRILCFGT